MMKHSLPGEESSCDRKWLDRGEEAELRRNSIDLLEVSENKVNLNVPCDRQQAGFIYFGYVYVQVPTMVPGYMVKIRYISEVSDAIWSRGIRYYQIVSDIRYLSDYLIRYQIYLIRYLIIWSDVIRYQIHLNRYHQIPEIIPSSPNWKCQNFHPIGNNVVMVAKNKGR